MGANMTVPPGKISLTIYKNAAFDETFFIEQEDEAGNITPMDLTGFTAKAAFSEDYEDDTPFLSFTTADDSIVIDEDESSVRLYKPASATKAITQEHAVFDLYLIPPTGAGDAFRILMDDDVCISKWVAP